MVQPMLAEQQARAQAEPLAHRGYGDAGLELARLAEKLRPAAVVVGSRGLSGARTVLGSVSDTLIVVGSRGRSAWRRIMVGSVATAVLHHAERPVLTVPSRP